MFNRNKNNPQVSQEQIAQCHTNFIALRRKCSVMLEKEVSRARYLAENNRRSKECEQRIKMLYYLIGLIDDGVDRLTQINSVNELNSTISELDTAFKQLNRLTANEKTTVKSIPRVKNPKVPASPVMQRNATEYNEKNALKSESLQSAQQTKVEEKPIAVNEELAEINMYLEGYFED